MYVKSIKEEIRIADISHAFIRGTVHSTMFPSSKFISMAFLPLRISKSKTPKQNTKGARTTKKNF